MVLRTAGTNCDHETVHALESVGAEVDRLHVNRLLDDPARLADYHLMVLPGGFSYADDIAAGRVLANKLRYHLHEQLAAFIEAGKPVLGICNGFQILLDLGLLMEPEDEGVVPATLTFNDSGQFECRHSWLKTESRSCCPYLQGLDARVLYPVAHGEGKFVTTTTGLEALESKRQVIFRYATDNEGQYPQNPNGSTSDIAGICSANGQVLGLMPHPERALSLRKNPQAMAMGQRFFENLVRAAAS